MASQIEDLLAEFLLAFLKFRVILIKYVHLDSVDERVGLLFRLVGYIFESPLPHIICKRPQLLLELFHISFCDIREVYIQLKLVESLPAPHVKEKVLKLSGLQLGLKLEADVIKRLQGFLIEGIHYYWDFLILVFFAHIYFQILNLLRFVFY